MELFRYGETELDHLRKKDQKLGLAIDRIGMIEHAVIPDLFAALVFCIVGQQISNKAAATVWKRLLEWFGEITPDNIAAAAVEEIQQCGLSMRKARYIHNLSETVAQGAFNLTGLPEMGDDEIIQRLSSLPGIGVWTAEMILIFSLQRPNIVSWGDLAIRRGMMKLYGHNELDKSIFERYKKRYSPYGSVASLYLWHISLER